MKKLIENYIFSPSEKTITFVDYGQINLEGILLITNVKSNTIIYNFSDATTGGTVSRNILTLTYNTLSMGVSDDLQIWYDDGFSESSDKSITNLLEQILEETKKIRMGLILSNIIQEEK